MSSVISSVFLLKVDTGEAIDATLHDRIEDRNLADWETKWQPIVANTVRQLASQRIHPARWPQDAHWDWRQKIQAMRGLLAGATFCIECEGATQGLMALDTAGRRARLDAQTGMHLVYVEYLEVAPWNRREHVASPRFRGAGSILMHAAIALSREEGFKGRVGLHSLPQANEFYAKKCGLTDLGPDSKYGNLRYFEMTPEQADKFTDGKERT